MLTVKKILVGADFSPQSQLAVGHAVRIATLLGADVVLAHAGKVIDPADAALAPDSAVLHEYQRIIQEHESENRQKLDALVAEVRARGVSAGELLLDGFADTALVEGAEQIDADLIAIGTHGHTGFQRLLLGSVAERVVRICRRHVLVAREPAASDTGAYRRILVPTDFTSVGERALDLALSLVATGGTPGTIDVMHAWHLPPFTSSLVPVQASQNALEPVVTSIEQGAREKAEALLEGRDLRGVSVTISIVNKPPSRGISDHAEAGGHDLIVMGGHGRRGLRRWILGSVAEATVRHAPCSVLVVHEKPSEE